MKFLSRLLGDTRQSTSHTTPTPREHIERALGAAGLDPANDPGGIRATIDRAFANAGLQPRAAPVPPVAPGAARVAVANEASAATSPAAGGRFLSATYANAHGRRDYRLYIPADYDTDRTPRPLVLMLHGCTQTAEDFAAGTRMNRLADRHGFLVAYPQQLGKANHAKCWNWFRPEDQRGDTGEPSVLAGIAGQVAQDHRVDAERIFVAGLSAGAAMAVILGRTHPDLVRAIGVHSGLPYASAKDVPSAFATMQNGQKGDATPMRGVAPGEAGVPLILFHGDQDRTVALPNAEAIAADALHPPLSTRVETGRVPGGHAYTRQVSVDESGLPWLEQWTVHGAGHAWSGGDPAGSYTDPAGPDASAEMVDFFLRQGPRQG
ncbi:extracellular catalytic domain type 1 short-chain-length polyhydroxyalkanoate depolymerase [Lysobacter sp. A3-1-A15]|uniref:extracellular catalytic domain type 1 short-chain-length polyhydroxyalkanoate depolymerase n=1 Tax=Novilysobacter viscosus TaxID=3098602 RepID=UPI002EDB9A30